MDHGTTVQSVQIYFCATAAAARDGERSTRNYKMGIPCDGVMRHVDRFSSNNDYDPIPRARHVSCLIWNNYGGKERRKWPADFKSTNYTTRL